MTFDLTRWGRQTVTFNSGQITLDGGVQNAPALFSYGSDSDTTAQVAAANYFAEVVNDLALNDIIYVSATDNSTWLYVATLNRETNTVTTGHVTSGGDIPLEEGKVLIGSASNFATPNFLTAGDGISIQSGDGEITISSDAGGVINPGTIYEVAYYSAADEISGAGPGTSGQLLQSKGNALAPDYTTATYPSTTTINEIIYSSANNTITGLATAVNGVLVTSNAGVPSILANSPTPGYRLTANTGAPPSWEPGGSGTVNAGTINQMAWYAGTGDEVSGLATANSGVLVTSSGGVPSISSTLPAFATSSITFSPTTGGIVGTTAADNADAGKVGEFLSSVVLNASAVSFATTVSKDVTSLSLSAGDWDVWANLTFIGSVQTGTQGSAWVSATSATAPDAALQAIQGNASGFTNWGVVVPYKRFNVASTTTIYLSGNLVFASGTYTGSGGIYARRVR